MEYSETLGHWIRSAPRTIRRKMFWVAIADYAIWFVAGFMFGKYVLPLVWS